MGQPDLSIGSDQIYTMRDLNQRTAQVMREINDNGRPALITRQGRFVAIVTPIAGKKLEGELIAKALSQGGDLTMGEIQGEAVVEHASRLSED